MAGEIQVQHGATGKTLYAIVRNSTASVWQTTTSTFVAYATVNLANYDIAMTEQGTASRYYAGDFPAAAAGDYSVVIFDRGGAAPAESDKVVGVGMVRWTGSAVLALGVSLPAAAAGASTGLLVSGTNAGTTTLGALTVTEATTLTGAVTASNASNNIVGIDVTKISGDATAADNAEAFFDGTGYVGTNNVIPLVTTTTTATNVTTVNGLAAGVITAASIATDAITATKIADGAIDTATFASGATIPRCTLVDTITAYTGNTPQTGDVFPLASTEIADIKAKTDNLPTDPADQSLIIAATNAIIAAVAGVQSDTDNIQTRLPAALIGGRMDSTTGAMATAVLTADALAPDAGTEIGTAVWASVTRTLTSTGLNAVLVDTKTLPTALQIIAALCGGKVSGAGSGTEVFVGLDGETTRATITVDNDGNRTAVVYG